MDTVTSIKSYCLDILLVSSRIISSNPNVRVRWSAPTDPFVKVNFDASFKVNTRSSTIGVVIRDMEGYILRASSTVSYRVSSSFAAEAQATIKGLLLASDLGFSRIEVEGDSRSVITKLQSKSQDTSDIGALISEAKGLSRNFRVCNFLFRHRAGNSVAHALADYRLSLDLDRIWVEDVPSRIELLAAEDRRWLDPP
ncbi:hypothetical protein HRI_004108400 [Hibiscus trionum]|uniref:RNase H type-1 domain-containing protein n=1 Tax=Hibiscus trionum TaxID=183268 RepID=A0A9W7ML01_HIBTR|nr:hypothetical protein HRI_004108400 [Hibiscus trionum]